MSALVSADCTLVVRRARKTHRCVTCRSEIEPGETYLEYLGETPAFQSGFRYCLSCGTAEWGEFLEVHP